MRKVTDDRFVGEKKLGESARIQGVTGINFKTQVCEKDSNLNSVLGGLKTKQKIAVSS